MTNLLPAGPALVRTTAAPPARIVHIGLGAFSRSHTAWYTAGAADAADWGISAYTGRSGALAEALDAQDGLYTLVVRSASGDTAETVGSIVAAHRGDDHAALREDLASASTAIVTLTVTEAGYRSSADGSPDTADAAVRADIAALRAIGRDELPLADARMETVLGRIVVGIEARRVRGSGPLALVCCDNIPDNGDYLRAALLGLASHLPSAADWLRRHASFVSTSVDRITPRLEAGEVDLLSERYGDRVPVVAEPFSDWVLSGEFPAGRPAWEAAGARFTDDLGPWEARKLWMLNGAHTLLANLGMLRGHAVVIDAFDDPICRAAVEDFWDEASAQLPADVSPCAYRAALAERFANPRIAYRLAQIAEGNTTKMRLRVAPVAERERRSGRAADACAAAIAAWIMTEHAGSADDTASRIATISSALAEDDEFVRRVADRIAHRDK